MLLKSDCLVTFHNVLEVCQLILSAYQLLSFYDP